MPVIGAVDIPDGAQYALLTFWLVRVLDDDDRVIPAQMTKRDPDVTGRCMTDEMMSRSEIVLALSQLHVLEETALRLAFGPCKFDNAYIARAIGQPEQEVKRLISSGLLDMKRRIFDGHK